MWTRQQDAALLEGFADRGDAERQRVDAQSVRVRTVIRAGGQFVIGLLVVNAKFLREHPDLVKNWIRANVDLTDWINSHKEEAKKLLNQQIQAETGKALSPTILDEAFARLQVTYDPLHSALTTAAQQAFEDGFLGRQMPDLSRLYDLALLNEVLAEKGKKAIQ